MNASQLYLDRARSAGRFPSDYALAKACGLPLTTISNYRTGRRQFDALAAFKIAQVIGVDAREVIAAVELDRAKSEQERQFWAKAARIGTVAASILLAPLLALSPVESRASLHPEASGGIYIMRRLGRWLGIRIALRG